MSYVCVFSFPYMRHLFADWAASEGFTGGPGGDCFSYADCNHGAGGYFEGRDMAGFIPPVQMMEVRPGQKHI